ncbi:protein phosphatase CheZ [Kosakonia sp. S42]|uniref:protein phosphatase CheZ n=1 Tax=Kosakonia sp. S42 TaxID=2767458 RepID=UPI00190CFFF4|nr:protein phosphatase CheZ [Kosakonia sp. S42]MBK0019433.1 protein phosphatase CheZ [Kosakonia sp. S42]
MSLPVHPGKKNDIHALILRTGYILRTLRDSLHQLGLDKTIAEVAGSIPDARARLGYVVTLTRDAADGVLNSVEQAQPGQALLAEGAASLSLRWDAWFESPGDNAQARALAMDTRDWLATVAPVAGATRQHLHAIMMAQGFQDLTGQIMQRMMVVLNGVEQQLVQVLRDNAPEKDCTGRSATPVSVLTADKPASQDDVDDLLANLGL